MLPDFNEVKAEVAQALTTYLRHRFHFYCTGMKDVPKEQLFEGGQMAIHRPSGQIDSTVFKESSSTLTISIEEAPNLTISDLLSRMDSVAQDMASKVEKTFYQMLTEELKKHDRTIDNRGKPLTADTVLEALSTMSISFDEHGNPELPQIHISPTLEEAAVKAHKDIETDPALNRRFQEIIAAKREEWRAEEASRRLVG